ncbi:MAG: hypothetical protein U0401_33160 [Anaerolineae bacterium]
MAHWQPETNQEKLNRLRAEVEQAQNSLIEAEAQLADRLAEVNAFEFEFEARVGYLIDQLAALEADIERYMERLHLVRQKQLGQVYPSVDEQYRRAWHTPPPDAPKPPPTPVSPGNEAEIKQLYRQLARRFHPDLAVDEADRAQRTEIMTAINNAYAARSLAELMALAQTLNVGRLTLNVSLEALQGELDRCQRRLREIERELQQIPQRPSVRLSFEVKVGRRRGRDVLGDMAAELERKIARKTVERDLLKAQFDQLGPDQGFIPINREQR